MACRLICYLFKTLKALYLQFKKILPREKTHHSGTEQKSKHLSNYLNINIPPQIKLNK